MQLQNLPNEAQEIISANYDETDRIDDAYVQDGDLFVEVNRGDVGSGAITDRYSLSSDN